MSSPLLQVKNLCVDFSTDEGVVRAVQGTSFQIPKSQTVGLVGESGSGKSVTALSIMRLIASPPGRIVGGEILFDNKNLVSLPERQLRHIRGNRISMIFQEPMTSLNPVFKVGEQIAEALMLHENLSKHQALEKAGDLLHQVGVPDPVRRLQSYPHEMSGGQRQRVMIAMAIACQPELLIADEPTTALDVTIQKQILDLLASLQEKYAMSVLFITHDLAVVADIADHVVVMYGGHIVEKNSCQQLFQNPQHPYTKGLLNCRPSLKKNPHRLPMVSDFMTAEGKQKDFDLSKLKSEKTFRPIDEAKNPVLLEVKALKTHFALEKNWFGRPTAWIKAVDDVSLQVRKGRTFGLVGESGCGKTTLGRSILRLEEPQDGQIIYDGTDLRGLDRQQMRHMRRRMQIIFQDPYASLNPRMTISSALIEPMTIHNIGDNKKQRRQRAEELMQQVELQPDMLNRYPHEFSGGQRQRICIARALAVEPEFIVCDESVSALDVSIQAQILNLLLDLQQKFNLTYIFISHDLAVVKFISDELAVMQNGQVVELADAVSIYEHPKHPYTKKLLQAIPKGVPKGLTAAAVGG